MTPEELDRRIEFIIESQARLASAQEQDRHDRVELQQWSKNLIARLARLEEHHSEQLGRHAELLDYQSRRMDRLDKFYEDWLRQNADFHKQALYFQKQALHLLNMILDRLPPSETTREA